MLTRIVSTLAKLGRRTHEVREGSGNYGNFDYDNDNDNDNEQSLRRLFLVPALPGWVVLIEFTQENVYKPFTMANFTTHLYGGAAVSSIASLGVYSLGLADTRQAQLYFALGTIGGLLPDIDADGSTPVRVFFTFLGVALAFVVSFAFVGKIPLVELGFVWLAVFGTTRFGVFEVFARFTVHRGVWHSWLAACFVAAATTNLAYWLVETPALDAWFSGLFVAVGYLTHLCLDEIASVDLLSSRVKRSFGTALKPFSTASLSASGLMLVALLVLIYLAPSFDPVLVAANQTGLISQEFGLWIRDPSLWLADLRSFGNAMRP